MPIAAMKVRAGVLFGCSYGYEFDGDGLQASRKLSAADLPFQVTQFRFLQAGGKNAIEINEDVHILASVSVTRPMSIEWFYDN